MAGACRTGWLTTGLNEVQFPKELRRRLGSLQQRSGDASMKCSSRRNCDSHVRSVSLGLLAASMKCSSRRNCDGPLSIARHHAHLRRLRERSALGLPPSHPDPLTPPHRIPAISTFYRCEHCPGILEHRSARIKR